MSDRREDDLSAIAWPGFVDILSAVIIMFVFFLMIVATALFFHIIIYKSKILSDVIIEQVESDVKYEFSQIQTEFAESEIQDVKIAQDSNELLIIFHDDAISVLPEVKQKVEDELRKYLAKAGPNGYRVTVRASKPDIGMETVVRKIATARLLNVRNVVIDVGFDPFKVIPRVVREGPIDGEAHWVKIILEEQ